MSKFDATPRLHVKGDKPAGAKVRPCGAELGCWVVTMVEVSR